MAKKQTQEIRKSRLSGGVAIPREELIAAEDKLRKARVQLLLQQPFFGTLATRLTIVQADNWLPNMATDGKYMYYNTKFVQMLEPAELEFVVSHEVLHVAYDHAGRVENRDKKLYNCAADYVINGELIEANIGKFPTTVPGLHDAKYKGWNSERVYDDLKQQQGAQSKEKAESQLNDMLDQLLDDHLAACEEDGEPGAQGEGQASGDKAGDGKPTKDGPAKISKEERESMREDMKQQLINAVASAGIGTVPAGVQRIVNQLTAPKMRWQELLQTELSSLIPADYSFMRMNRNNWHLPVILPGIVMEEQLFIDCAIDMSGSIGQKEATEFLSEVKGIMDQYPAFTINVFCFDTEVYGEKQFTSEDHEDISTYHCKGGGGTDGGCIYRHLKSVDRQPSKLVIFTDGYVGDFGPSDYCDTLWVIKGSDVVPPHGMTAYFD